MKRNKIILSSLLLAAAGMASCDDEKQLTLDAPEVKLMESIVLEVSDVLPLPVGMDSTIVYTCSPEDAVDLTVVFSSSDESVATVSQDGTIHAIKPGEATITAQNPFGFDIYETSASVQVHVIPELIPVERIEIPPRLRRTARYSSPTNCSSKPPYIPKTPPTSASSGAAPTKA